MRSEHPSQLACCARVRCAIQALYASCCHTPCLPHTAKLLIATGRLRADAMHTNPQYAHALAQHPNLWDSLRLTTTVQRERDYPALAYAVNALSGLCEWLGASEIDSGRTANAAWPPAGIKAGPALLSVVPGNGRATPLLLSCIAPFITCAPAGTRYGMHADSTSWSSRKLTMTWFPEQQWEWAAPHGGELRVLNGSGGGVAVPPRADRLVIFSSELAHEVLVSSVPRVSLTFWGRGVGERREAPPSARDTVERQHACTSVWCERAVRAGGPLKRRSF